MKKRDLIILFLLGITVTTAVASFQSAPGYMDADYYYSGGVALASGQGFQEQFLWNYLDSPVGIPHPSHTYWMPLASITAAIAPLISGNTGFQIARIPFILLSGLVPIVTALLSVSLSGERKHGWMAGLLAVFPGFYLAYAGTTDTFILYMLLGASFILLTSRLFPLRSDKSGWRWISVGLVAGLMHLARADGILWLLLGLGSVFLRWMGEKNSIWRLVNGLGWILLGYLVVMGPWMVHTMIVSGAPLSPGGWHALWILNYDELYSYPVSHLTFQRWWAAGTPALVASRGQALLAELKTGLGVQGEVFLLPLAITGGWRMRKSSAVRLGIVAWLMLLAVMVMVFPFAGSRGGFLHSGAAIQPLVWALVPIGFQMAINKVGRARGWNIPQASRVFAVGLVILAILYTGFVTFPKVVGKEEPRPIWNSDWQRSLDMEAELVKIGAARDAIALVNNPPGFTSASGRRSIVIPDGTLDTILQAARQYGATYLVVEFDHARSLDDLYEHPRSLGKFELVQQSKAFSIYRIAND
ncbi:MAG: hypothetical protein PHQ40_14200 [Anaerolineaceae bacterium]|nr:hypothetical protein [Anaerolineaceae bacterium]